MADAMENVFRARRRGRAVGEAVRHARERRLGRRLLARRLPEARRIRASRRAPPAAGRHMLSPLLSKLRESPALASQ
jgi:hypothetical protein